MLNRVHISQIARRVFRQMRGVKTYTHPPIYCLNFPGGEVAELDPKAHRKRIRRISQAIRQSRTPARWMDKGRTPFSPVSQALSFGKFYFQHFGLYLTWKRWWLWLQMHLIAQLNWPNMSFPCVIRISLKTWQMHLVTTMIIMMARHLQWKPETQRRPTIQICPCLQFWCHQSWEMKSVICPVNDIHSLNILFDGFTFYRMILKRVDLYSR